MDVSENNGRNTEMLIELTADVVSAYVSNNSVAAADLPGIIADVHAALGRAGSGADAGPVEKPKPAVNPKKSIHEDYIICLEDGKKFKSLKRHLMTHYNLTPEQYREKWGLEPGYPMVAPNYAAARSELAKKMGLGRKRKTGRGGRKG
jgi:predicted transcriptional regulator